jgi:hypothetical protein
MGDEERQDGSKDNFPRAEGPKLTGTHELVLLTHLATELKYLEYERLKLRNLNPLKSEVKERISKLTSTG